jgi:putative addiction module component (TIGR02574 family)
MSTVIAEILERARTLPRDEQAELAGEIVALLDDGDDDPAVVEREWAAELTRRAERAVSGESTGRPWSEVRERLVARLRAR